MAALNMQRMSQTFGTMVSWLKMKEDYYNRLNRGEFKCVLVEGKTDQQLLNRGVGAETKVHVVGEVLKSQNLFRMDYAARCAGTKNSVSEKKEHTEGNAKGSVIDIIYGLKMASFINAPKEAENWQLYGVVDSDYDSDTSAAIPPNLSDHLFKTDTHDIETLLLMTDSDLLLRILDGFFCEEDVKKAFALAYQMAKLRIAIYENAEKMSAAAQGEECVPLRVLARNRLRYMPDEDLELFVEEWSIDLPGCLNTSAVACPALRPKLRCPRMD